MMSYINKDVWSLEFCLGAVHDACAFLHVKDLQCNGEGSSSQDLSWHDLCVPYSTRAMPGGARAVHSIHRQALQSPYASFIGFT